MDSEKLSRRRRDWTRKNGGVCALLSCVTIIMKLQRNAADGLFAKPSFFLNQDVDYAGGLERCPVDLTDGPIYDQTFTIDDITCGMHPQSEQFPHLTRWVQENREGTGLLFQKFFYGFGAFLAVYPVNLETLGSVLGIKLLERRTFFPTIGSPGSPEIQQNDLSGRVFKIEFSPIEIFDREIRGPDGLCIGMEYG
jgi:hypothetical protein